MKISMVYNIVLQRYMDKKIRVGGQYASVKTTIMKLIKLQLGFLTFIADNDLLNFILS